MIAELLVAEGYDGMGSDMQASKEAGFDVHLTKPVDFDQPMGTIRALQPLGRRSGGRD
jgi:hypothetical protein